MTAVVGILNKQSVALAADSAVTIGGPGNRKIFNRANKLFALSKCQPVGIMLYNSATLMDTPWETIIKMYRHQLTDRRFNTIREYQEDFFAYLRQKEWFTNAQVSEAFLRGFFAEFLNSIVNDAARITPTIFQQIPQDVRQIVIAIEQQAEDVRSQIEAGNEFCPDFADYPYGRFIQEYGTVFTEVLQQVLGTLYQSLQQHETEVLLKAGWLVLRTKEKVSSFTGLIFSGFGEAEIFPSLVAFNVSFAVGGRLRYHEDVAGSVNITHENPGAVADFAQTDVIRTILTGIDPFLDQVHQRHFQLLLSKFRDDLVGSFGQQNTALKQALEQMDLQAVAQSYYDMNARLQNEKYIIPMLTAVNTLSKEDLAEMAESLIYLTYLKRRITFAEESVGGPVDVAIISKGDGLVWIKRKHYFASALNPHFFDNYFKT